MSLTIPEGCDENATGGAELDLDVVLQGNPDRYDIGLFIATVGGASSASAGEDPCADFIPPCTADHQCPWNEICVSDGCLPSYCECDPNTGMVYCSADCDGRACMPEPSTALLGAIALVTLILLRSRSRVSSAVGGP